MLSFIIPLLCFTNCVYSEGIADVAAGSPSSSPIERSNRTIFSDGALHIINSESTSFDHETIIVTDESTLLLKEDGYIIGMYISCVLYVLLCISCVIFLLGAYSLLLLIKHRPIQMDGLQYDCLLVVYSMVREDQ